MHHSALLPASDKPGALSGVAVLELKGLHSELVIDLTKACTAAARSFILGVGHVQTCMAIDQDAQN